MFLKNNDHSGSFIEPCRKSYNREVKFNPSGRPGQTRFLNISWPQPFNVHLKAGLPAGNQDKKGNVVSYRIGGESTQYILPARSSRKKYREHSWKIDYYPVQEKKKGENQENWVSPFSSGSFRDRSQTGSASSCRR